MVGLVAVPGVRVRDARHRARVAGQAGDPVGAGIGAEVVIEAAVLLHDDHDVLDLVDAGLGRRRGPSLDAPVARAYSLGVCLARGVPGSVRRRGREALQGADEAAERVLR